MLTAQLSQRDRATRYVSKLLLCFTRRELERLQTAKVTFKVIGGALAIVPFDRPHMISC